MHRTTISIFGIPIITINRNMRDGSTTYKLTGAIAAGCITTLIFLCGMVTAIVHFSLGAR